MMRAIRAEFAKLRRSRMLLWSALIPAVAAGLSLAVIPVLADLKTQTQIASGGGPFAKAVAAGLYEPSWVNVLRIGTQGMTGSWGLLAFGLVTAYLFGREYTERTVTVMHTLPVRREYVVVAKTVVLGVWVFGLGIVSVLLTMGVAAALGASGFAWSHVLGNVTDTLAAVAPLYLTLPFVAYFANLGRGYLPPMLFSLGLVMVGNALVETPVSPFVPWNMPLHLLGASWYPVPPTGLVAGSWLAAVCVFALGLGALMWQADHADSAR